MELDRYPRTGHASVIGRHIQSWYNREAVLELFGRKVKLARTRYRSFVGDEIGDMRKLDYSGGGLVRSAGGWESVKFLRREHEARIGDERILVDSDFVAAVLKTDQLAMN